MNARWPRLGSEPGADGYDDFPADLVPADCSASSVSFGAASLEAHLRAIANLTVEPLDFPPRLAAAAPRRLASYAAGRLAAARALQLAGAPPVALGRGPSGEPLWPPGYTGSITHKDGLASAIVGRRSAYLSMGIDAETVFADRTASEILDEVVSPEESASLQAARISMASALSVAFSAKEAVFKAAFPVLRLPLEFRDLTIDRFSLNVLSLKLRMRDRNRSYAVRYTIGGNRVSTVCFIPTPSAADA